MGHPPVAQLLQDPGLASHGQLARPFPVYTEPERASGGERQIDQLNPKLLRSLKVGNDHAVMRFGAGHAPFYRSKANNARTKAKRLVHEKKYSPVYEVTSTSS
jgi:hypothetical protein